MIDKLVNAVVQFAIQAFGVAVLAGGALLGAASWSGVDLVEFFGR